MRSDPKIISLFSGAGGMDLGFIQAGFHVICANDLDQHACNTYKVNIGPHISCQSIELVDLSTLPDCDVVIGGPPCQGFSVAGKMDPNDPRSKLIWDFYRVVEAKLPKYFVMENVSALGRLEKFKDIRELLFKRYADLGYETSCKVLNSKDFEVPQKRERFFLIGARNDQFKIKFPEPINKEISAREAIIDLGEAGEGINLGVCNAKITVAQYPVLRKSPYAGMLFNGLGRPICLDLPAQTLPASMGGNKTPILDTRSLKDPSTPNWVETYHQKVSAGIEFNAYDIVVPNYLRRLTVREAARIQGFPDDFVFTGPQSQQYKQIGNAVPPRLAFHIGTALRKLLVQ